MAIGEDLERADLLPGTGPPTADQLLLVRDTLLGKDFKMPGSRLGQPGAGQYVLLTAAGAAALLSNDPNQIMAIRYRITRPDGDVELVGIPTDQANNVPGGFSPTGFWQNPATGAIEAVTYDVVSDNPQPIAGGSIALSGITEFRDRFGTDFSGTVQRAFETLLVRYQTPKLVSFLLGGLGTQTVEVGTAFPAGFKSFTWATSNPGNVQVNSLTLSDETSGAVLAASEANDGVLSASTAAFTVIFGRSRTYRLGGLDTSGAEFAAEIGIDGAYKSYLILSANPALSAAELVALGGASGVLQNGRARTASGITASGGQYLYYAYEASAGDLTSIILDGAAPVLGAFAKRPDAATPNAQGVPVALRSYRSNAADAFANNTLAFS